MSDSNELWGEAQEDPVTKARLETWQALPDLPAPGANKLLDRLLEDKCLEHADLLRIGTRWGSYNDEPALVYHFLEGLKYRVLTTGVKITEKGAEWKRAKIIRGLGLAGKEKPVGVIVAEGETDAAQLSRRAPKFDVAIMPSGARLVTPTMIEQFRPYPLVLAALDDDQAGNDGAAKITEALAHARRLLPPANDWCAAAKEGLIPEDWDPAAVSEPPPRLVFTLGEILDADLGDYAENNWFAEPILPLNGLTMIHGKKKSLKSFIMLELLRAVSCGDAFAGSSAFCRPSGCGKVLLFQMEIPPFYFQQRLLALYRATPLEQREQLRRNFTLRGIGDGKLLRLKIDKAFIEYVRRCADEVGAEVLAFDPIQRMTGSASLDRANEVDALLDSFAQLQQHGYTVVFSHHNNKASGKATKDADSASGSQRFSGDPDALCSVWWDEPLAPDDNDEGVKERNFTWELRNGVAQGRNIRVEPVPNSDLMTVQFRPLLMPSPKPNTDDDSFKVPQF